MKANEETKKNYLIVCVAGLVILFSSIIWYYKCPIQAEDVLVGRDDVYEIHLIAYKGNNHMNYYNIEFKDSSKVERFIEVFSKSGYTRIPGSRNIANDGNYIMMAVVYGENFNNNMVIVEVNDKGYLKVDANTYKFTKNNTDIFNELYEMLVVGNKPIEPEK
ncbi:hypothetical protein [Bacillus sp. FJAT-27445]|uniref:hypothetical protein n=1 Tax=Bacillus sp. FJAT-27445 TaxID=1679166 RepID=UPI000743D23C|nr:hypothetical protein [Bacillus sp. FJAT-27445]